MPPIQCPMHLFENYYSLHETQKAICQEAVHILSINVHRSYSYNEWLDQLRDLHALIHQYYAQAQLPDELLAS